MVTVLVTGANGQLGRALQKIAHAQSEAKFVFLDSSTLDITDAVAVSDRFEAVQPDYVINAAAYTAVDKAESEAEKAYAVNAKGVANLAAACKEHHCVLLHISTDFVFDGTSRHPYKETDATGPQGVYGASKLKGEEQIAEIGGPHFIVRTSWLYSEFGHNFLKTMLRLGRERDELGVVNDQIGTPTNANDLARALLAIIESHEANPGNAPYGVYHYSNTGSCSWYGFAKEIFRQSEISITLNPIPTSAYPTPAKRPHYSVMDTEKIRTAFSLEIPEWSNSLSRVLEALR